MDKTIYEIKVVGQYFVKGNESGGLNLKRYELVVKLGSMDSALSVIKGRLLDRLLKAKYIDYVSYRTHEIAGVKCISGHGMVNDIWHMDRGMLCNWISEKKYRIKNVYYPKLFDLRSAVMLYEEDPERYMEYEKDVEKDWKIEEELSQLNPELNDDIASGVIPEGEMREKVVDPNLVVSKPKETRAGYRAHAGKRK